MALAAQPQLHFPPQSKAHEPSWDEAIVPALRHRQFPFLSSSIYRTLG